MDPIVIKNLSTASEYVVRGVTINPEGTYAIPADQIIAWARDGYLRFLIESASVSVVLYGVEIFTESASTWMNRISTGAIVI